MYPRERLLERLVEFARQHDLVILADEIYDRILYDDATHTVLASLAPDVFCLTFSGLSKSYRVAGFRAGWVVVSGPKEHARGYLAGLSVLANMRLCPNVPSQHAIPAALGGEESINELILPGGRLLAQRDTAWRMLNAIPGVSCTKPKGALYVFPRLDPAVYPIARRRGGWRWSLLRAERILVTHGRGFFNWPAPRPPADRHVAGGRGARGRDRPLRRVPDLLPAVVAVAPAATVGAAARPGPFG